MRTAYQLMNPKENTTQPDLVSVVMCTYNGALYVAEQLESILQQTHGHLEIIIADDASTDDTYQILKRYAVQDRRIILYQREKNAGYNTNFSEACAKATGAFIAIADQDDIWEAGKIESLLKTIKSDAGIVLVHSISARFEEREKPHLRSLRLVNYFRGNDIRIFFLSNFISGHNMLLRRALLEQALPFPPHVYYDWWLAAQACVLGKIEAVEEVHVWHRMHGKNATGGAKPKLLFYKQVQAILPTVLGIKGINPQHRAFGQQLLRLYQDFPQKRFSPSLYFFLLRHAPVVFAYKKRLFPWVSYAKHAWRYSKKTTLA
jgi:glycosyltransferase involved in cell wall biosynthesis